MNWQAQGEIIDRKIKRYFFLGNMKILTTNYSNAFNPVTSIPVISKWISCVPS